MRDKEFLLWLYERLNLVHKESKDVNYMLKLMAIIRNYPDDKITPNAIPQIISAECFLEENKVTKHWSGYRIEEAFATCTGKFKGIDLSNSLSKQVNKYNNNYGDVYNYDKR